MLFGRDTPGRSLQDAADRPMEAIGVVAARTTRTATRKSRPTIYYNYLNQGGPPPDRIKEARFSAPIGAELDRAELNTNVVSPSYFAAMGSSLVAGRIFSENPECRVAVVNQEAADLYFGGTAVGAAIIDDLGQRTEIIGVVRSAQLAVFERRVEPTVYFPMAQDCLPVMTLIVGARARVVDGTMLAKAPFNWFLAAGRCRQR